jgi:dolichyl-phosphate-mannose--protein O-mannosyl transferase
MEALAGSGAPERPRRLAAVAAILAVSALAFGLRIWNLGVPPVYAFDEVYYAKSGCIFLGWSEERCDVTSNDEQYWYRERFDVGAWVHPPLGKWAIGLGERAFGFDARDGLDRRDAFAYRVASAVAGTLTVAALALIVQLLFGSPLWTLAGGALLATEGLSIVQSRVAMLDVFVGFWTTLAFLFLVLDRRWIDARTVVPDPGAFGPGEVWLPVQPVVPSPIWRPWRFACGVAIGCAAASKWSGAMAIPGIGLLSLGWECVRRRRAGQVRWFLTTVKQEGFGFVLALLVVPVIAYIASWTGWFVHFGWNLRAWADLQASIAHYHAGLRLVNADGKPWHPYLSQARDWFILRRPVLYFARYYGVGMRRVIYANGNPVVFWGTLLALPTAAIAWWRRGDWRAGVAVTGILTLYVPWLLVPRPQFLFYALPVVPFMVLAMVVLLRDLVRGGYPVIAGAIVVAALGIAVLMWPTYVGLPLDSYGWELRAWFPSWT